MHTGVLAKTTAPWLHACPGSVVDIVNELRQWELAAPGKRVARIVRGQKCATAAEFFSEIAAALQFPVTFGENWDALADCLRDWNHLPSKAAIAICITDADKLLLSGPSSAVGAMAGVLTMCVEDINAPPKPRKPRPLHVMFQCRPSVATAMTKRWQAACLKLTM